MSLAECVSAKLLLDLRQPHSVIRRVRLRQTLPDPRQSYDVARRVRLSQTVVRSMSAE